MALVPEDKERHVIPNWRGFSLTASQRELSAFTLENKRKIDISEYIYDWKHNRNISYAGDLIGAAIANNLPINEDIQDAAVFVLHNVGICSELLQSAAKYVLGLNTELQSSSRYTNCRMVLDSIIQRPELYKNIAYLKNTIKIYPYNPIPYVEISRFYAILGQNNQAEKYMRIALYLANNNRYVIRSAVRLFTHINKQDEALFILRHSEALKYDPWLLSADISLTTLLGKHQRYIKVGQIMVADQNYSRNSISELSSAIATLEFANGALKNSRKLFDISLYDPTDNSLAQAEWARSKSLDINADKNNIEKVSNNYEANTIASVNQDKYNDALFYSTLWIKDIQYATSPIMYASHIAISLVQDLDISEQILHIGLASNPSDPTLLNNLAYVYALSDKVEKAEQCIIRANSNKSIPESTKLCLSATQGLLEFRKGNPDLGRILYSDVINQTKNANYPELNWSAIINYAREEIQINSEYASSAIDAVKQITERAVDKDITMMKQRLLKSLSKS